TPMTANPFLNSTLGAMLAECAGRFSEREAVVAGDQRITYAELHRRAQQFARGLSALGVRQGDKVALWLPNRPAWLVAQYGCALISHRNCRPHGWYCGEAVRLTPADRVLHALPFSGTWGGLCIPLAALTHGACLVVMESFEAGEALRLIEQERISVWNGVDAMALALLEHPDLARRDRSTLRTGGFALTGGAVEGLFEAVVE